MERFEGNVNEISCYVCGNCGQVTKVRQIVNGIAAGGIDCPACGIQAGIEIDTYPNIPVTYEWYRPTLDEVFSLAEENRMFTVSFVLNGGLLRRPCSQS